MTVCTNSREQKKIIKSYLKKTGCVEDGLMFKLHDFGYRGVSSVESAATGGAAHLARGRALCPLDGVALAPAFKTRGGGRFPHRRSTSGGLTPWRASC